MNLNELRDKIHENAKQKGFYDIENKVKMWCINSEKEIDSAFLSQKIDLIYSELSEALEADRNGKHFKSIGTNDVDTYYRDVNKLGFKQAFEENVKDTFEDEITDALIRILDLCGHLDIDIDWHVDEKMKYNTMRPQKHGKLY